MDKPMQHDHTCVLPGTPPPRPQPRPSTPRPLPCRPPSPPKGKTYRPTKEQLVDQYKVLRSRKIERAEKIYGELGTSARTKDLKREKWSIDPSVGARVAGEYFARLARIENQNEKIMLSEKKDALRAEMQQHGYIADDETLKSAIEWKNLSAPEKRWFKIKYTMALLCLLTAGLFIYQGFVLHADDKKMDPIAWQMCFGLPALMNFIVIALFVADVQTGGLAIVAVLMILEIGLLYGMFDRWFAIYNDPFPCFIGITNPGILGFCNNGTLLLGIAFAGIWVIVLAAIFHRWLVHRKYIKMRERAKMIKTVRTLDDALAKAQIKIQDDAAKDVDRELEGQRNVHMMLNNLSAGDAAATQRTASRIESTAYGKESGSNILMRNESLNRSKLIIAADVTSAVDRAGRMSVRPPPDVGAAFSRSQTPVPAAYDPMLLESSSSEDEGDRGGGATEVATTATTPPGPTSPLPTSSSQAVARGRRNVVAPMPTQAPVPTSGPTPAPTAAVPVNNMPGGMPWMRAAPSDPPLPAPSPALAPASSVRAPAPTMGQVPSQGKRNIRFKDDEPAPTS